MQNLLNTVQKHNVAVEKFVQPVKTFNDYAEDISKANTGSLYAQIEIGKIFTEAKEKLGKKEFNKLLKDGRVRYKKTQANKLIRCFRFKSDIEKSGQSTDQIQKLGIEKIDKIMGIEDTAKRKEIQDFTLSNNLSVSNLKKVITKIEENENLTLKQALEIVKQEKHKPKEKVVTGIDLEQYVERTEYLKLKEELEQLKQELMKYKS